MVQTFSYNASLHKEVEKAEARYNFDKTQKQLFPNGMDFKKITDKTMKKIRLVTSVLLAVKRFRNQDKPFSIFQITEYIRKQLVDNEYKLYTITQSVPHERVKSIFEELRANGILTGLKESDSGHGYRLFSNEDSKKLVHDHSIAALNNAEKIRQLLQSAQVLQQPVQPVQPVNEAHLLQDITYYIGTRNDVTIKMIQSRFKGVKKTCSEYVSFLTGKGFALYKSSGYVSQYLVLNQ